MWVTSPSFDSRWVPTPLKSKSWPDFTTTDDCPNFWLVKGETWVRSPSFDPAGVPISLAELDFTMMHVHPYFWRVKDKMWVKSPSFDPHGWQGLSVNNSGPKKKVMAGS